MRTLFFCLFGLSTLAGYAQTAPPLTVPADAVTQLEDLKETTKQVVVTKATKARMQAETRPEVNRLLVLAADNFVRITTAGKPTREAYLQSLDNDLARIAPLATDEQDRRQIAEYFQELLEIVGLPSSEGRLTAFALSPVAKQ